LTKDTTLNGLLQTLATNAAEWLLKKGEKSPGERLATAKASEQI